MNDDVINQCREHIFMKILHIAECTGGVERYLLMLLPRLEKKGIRQSFICSKNYDTTKFENLVDNVKQIDLKRTFSPSEVVRNVCLIRKQILHEHPDIVYCHSSFAGVLGRLAAIGVKCSVVYNPHGWAFNMRMKGMKLKRILFLLIEKCLAMCTDKFICISNAEKESALKFHIAKEKKLELIPNGIDLDAVINATPISRAKLGIPDDAFVVGMVGRISPQKSPDVFIRAAKLINEQISNSVFMIVGDGEERDKIETFAKNEGLNLIVTKWTENPYSYLNVFNVALLLSRWEGFGLAIVEYMAARINLVATRVDAIPMLIDDRVDGLLVDVDSPEEVCSKVLWLRNHQEEALKMKYCALQKVKENYNINRVVDQHVKMFVDLCHKLERNDKLS